MTLKIIRIENHVITCELEGGGLIDIARKGFFHDIKEKDIIEFDVNSRR